MLINIDTFEPITTVAHAHDFNAWKSKLTEEEFQSIVDYMNEEIDAILENEEDVINVTIMAQGDWDGKPYQAIYEKACDRYEDLAALFFGSITWYVVMNRDEKWGCGKYNFVKNRDIQGMTYFLVNI